jgi:hypothetical protein
MKFVERRAFLGPKKLGIRFMVAHAPVPAVTTVLQRNWRRHDWRIYIRVWRLKEFPPPAKNLRFYGQRLAGTRVIE